MMGDRGRTPLDRCAAIFIPLVPFQVQAGDQSQSFAPAAIRGDVRPDPQIATLPLG